MSRKSPLITSPHDGAIRELCEQLGSYSEQANSEDSWPDKSLRLCGDFGVFGWFIEREYGGQGWSPAQIAEGYLKLSSACLTTTFIITQRTASTQRVQASTNELLKSELLPKFSTGELSTTVGISHLTTSHQHTQPAMTATYTEGGFVVDGFSPWVTGGKFADKILMGATLPDNKQILFLVDQANVTSDPEHQLMALTGSATGRVSINELFVPESDLIGGPIEEVIKSAAGSGAKTGGSQTSTLAIGLAGAAIEYIADQACRRSELLEVSRDFREQLENLKEKLLQLAIGNEVCSVQNLRIEANSLVLRSTQAALAAAKGAGYVAGHRVGRWCREAMFFLVWSCPQPVPISEPM